VIPESIQVGTVTYRVTTDPEEYGEHANVSSYGWTSNTKAVIGINPETPPEVQRLSLWHEVLHALNSAVLSDPDWTSKGMPKGGSAAEELMVRRLEHPTLAVLRDNPHLTRYLMGWDADQDSPRTMLSAVAA
jgi:hypothetical protein